MSIIIKMNEEGGNIVQNPVGITEISTTTLGYKIPSLLEMPRQCYEVPNITENVRVHVRLKPSVNRP